MKFTLKEKMIIKEGKIDKMKRAVVFLVILSILACPIYTQAASTLLLTYGGKTVTYKGKQLKATYNGNVISNGKTPGILEGNTALFSYEDIFIKSDIGAKGSYDKSTKKITITLNGNKIVMKLGSKIAKVNGKTKTLSVSPRKVTYKKAKKTKILVPARFVAENLGLIYSWYSKTGTVAIEKKGMSITYGDQTYNYLGSKVNFQLNKEKLETSMPGIIVDGYVLAPVKSIFGSDGLDISYSYSSTNKILTLSNDTNTCKITLDSDVAEVNKEEIVMPTKARMVTNNDTKRTYLMVPIEFAAESLGYDYTWKESSKTSIISEPSDSEKAEDVWNTITIPTGTDEKGKILETIDDYWNRQYVITLSGDLTNYIQMNPIVIEDNSRATVYVSLDNNGNTKIIIKTNIIRGFLVEKLNQSIKITIKPPRELYKAILVLDPGHGGIQPGALGADYGNDLVEKDLTLDLVLRAKKYFDQTDSVKVYYTRITDTTVSLAERAKIANEVDADYFLSIHIDAYPENLSIRGTKAFYSSITNQSGTTGLTANKLADIILKRVNTAVGSVNRGIDKKNLQVLNESNMPAVLLEVAFLSNNEDAEILNAEDARDRISNSIYQSVMDTVSLYSRK